MGTDLEKFSIISLVHQCILCNEWVPSEWVQTADKNITMIHTLKSKKLCVCKKQIHHKVIAQVYSKPVTKSLLVPIDIYNIEKVLWKSMGTRSWLKKLLFTSQDINWWTGVVWITCRLLWCFYQLFGLSFWRHPFTADDPLLNKWCNATFLQIGLLKKQTYLHLGWPEDEDIFIFGWTIPLSRMARNSFPKCVFMSLFILFFCCCSFSYFSTPSGNTISAAELTCALLMSLSR